MDLVRELKDVRFELNLRGYDCEAVDAFLAKLRSDIASVQSESADARARVAELEHKVEAGGGSTETEGTLRRTLILAQRLADETEAESKKAAAELIEGATAEAESLRTSADAEAASMRETGEVELAAARDEATALRESTNEDAAMGRSEARQQTEAILTEAEQRGVERVAVIEETAQAEAAGMREPIRVEISELEGVRGRLLGDIGALESHLEQQRVRVRTAVEALRVGMSGSIDDLERVAEDDELLATQPSPEHSGAAGADVAVAPEVDIVERVNKAAPPAPTVDEVEDAALADLQPIVDATESESIEDDVEVEVEASDEADIDDEIEVDEVSHDDDESHDDDSEGDDSETDGAEDEDDVVDGSAADDGPDMFADVVADDEIAGQSTDSGDEIVAEVVDEGPKTEPIPVFAMASEADLDEAELVVLDDEPSALFGTDLGSDAEVDELESADGEADAGDVEAVGGFVDRFAEALDVLPLPGDR